MARDVGWSVLDVAVSSDKDEDDDDNDDQVSSAGDCLVYSSWNENLHLVKLGAGKGAGVHVPLPLAPDDIQFCIFR